MPISEPNHIKTNVGCIASAVDVLGRKWTALILRDLMGGPKGFCELERSVRRINPRTLSKRLDDLEKQGIISDFRAARHYQLTAKGEALLPILKQMAAWGNEYPN